MPMAVIVSPHVWRYISRDKETFSVRCELNVGLGEIRGVRCVREVQMHTQLKHCIL